MIIREFIKTEEGRKYTNLLKPFRETTQIAYWNDLEEYITALKNNKWTDEEISEQVKYIRRAWFKVSVCDKDFVEVFA